MRTKEFADRMHKLGYKVFTYSDYIVLCRGNVAKCLINETRFNKVEFRDYSGTSIEELDLINKYTKTPIDERSYKEFR